MGKISVLTKEQEFILDLVAKSKVLTESFYFTGGTALSHFYLQHRYSEDLDFFSEKKFDNEVIFSLLSDWSKKYQFRFSSRFVEVVYRFEITFKNKVNVKVDFAYQPYKRVEKGLNYHGFEVSSLRDIATNKLLTINQRTDVKDFVDLYFLLKEKYTVWDLLYSAEVKFETMEFDILLLAEDFLKVEDFTVLPRMIKPLTLLKLKHFFRQKAIELGKRVVE